MAFYSGIDGILYFGTGTVVTGSTGGGCSAKVKNWQWTVSQEVLDTTSICDTDRTIIPSTRSTTGSCSLHYYGSNSSASQLINKIIKTGSGLDDGDNQKSSQVTFRLQIDGKSILIPAWITSASMTCSVGEVVSVDISFEASGAAVSNTL